MTAPLPLWRPELLVADLALLEAQARVAPLHDPALLARWEAAWADRCGQAAVAFATPDEVVRQLAALLGWPPGWSLAATPLLPPHWLEAVARAGGRWQWLDLEPASGAPQGVPTAGVVALWRHHPFGLLLTAPAEGSLVEEVSTVLAPGAGPVSVLCLEGNRMVAAGGSCVVLSADAHLAAALRRVRQRPPSALACQLGLAQLERLPAVLARRAELAERYLAVRWRGLCGLPPTAAGRCWDAFVVLAGEAGLRDSLGDFLNKAGIGAAPPVWWRPPAVALPGWRDFQARSLALPLYAALSDGEQKRIINRIHRWCERQP